MQNLPLKPNFLWIFFLLIEIINVSAQNSVGINTTTPHASAALDITSPDKGILIPRLTLSQRNAIASPAIGLMIYQTDNTPGFYYVNYLGNWVKMTDKNSEFNLPYVGTTGFGQQAFSVTHNNGPVAGIAIKGVSSNTPYGIGVEGRSNDPGGYGIKAINNGNGSALYAESNTLYTSYGAIQAYHSSGGNAIYASTEGSNPNYAAIQADNYGGGFAIKATRSTNESITGSAIFAQSYAPAGYGVRGISDQSNTAGIRGESVSGVGVSGYSAASQAISGVSVSGIALKGLSTSGYALDAAGKIRMTTANTPTPGAVLTSADALGNAVWKEDNVAFAAYGMNSTYNNFPAGDFIKVHFGGEKFDLGADYNLLAPGGTPTTTSSSFVIPVNGIYHFDVSLSISTYPEETYSVQARLMLNRNGVISAIALAKGAMPFIGGEAVNRVTFSTDEILNTNDIIYIELRHFSEGPATIVYGFETWFNGHLVKAL